MTSSAECAICREPLPTIGAVALVERHQLVHLRCCPQPQPLPAVQRAQRRQVTLRSGRRAPRGLGENLVERP
jgi:hypothetical protein